MFKYIPFLVRIRRFEKDYNVPFTATLLLLILLVIVALMRYQDRSEMARIFEGTSQGGQDYAVLVSHDKTDEIKTQGGGDDTEKNTSTTSGSVTTSISNNNATRNTTTTTPTPPPGSTPPSSTPPPSPTPVPFSSSISYFRQDGSTMNCPLLNLNSGNCKKIYNFSASVRTIGGPGTVQYGWISNMSGATENRSFSVGSGEVFTTLSKSISVACNKPGTVTLQIVLTSPTTAQSNVIAVEHAC